MGVSTPAQRFWGRFRMKTHRSAKNGVLIQLEDHGAGTSRLPRIRKILDYGGNHPSVKVCWNSNPTDLLDGGFASNFKLVRDQIGQVHMRDLFVEEYPWLMAYEGDSPRTGP